MKHKRSMLAVLFVDAMTVRIAATRLQEKGGADD